MYDGKGRIAAMVPRYCFLCGDLDHQVKDCPENPRNRDCKLDRIQAQLSKHGKGTIAAATEKPPKRKSAVDKLIANSKCEPKKCFSTTPHSECDAACALCILRCGKSFEESKLCKGVKGADNHYWGCKLHFWHQAAEKQKVTKAQLLEVFPKSGERIATKHGCAGLTGSPMTADTAFEDYLSNEGFYADAEISGAYE